MMKIRKIDKTAVEIRNDDKWTVISAFVILLGIVLTVLIGMLIPKDGLKAKDIAEIVFLAAFAGVPFIPERNKHFWG